MFANRTLGLPFKAQAPLAVSGQILFLQVTAVIAVIGVMEVIAESQGLLTVLVFTVTSPQPGPYRLVENCPIEMLGLLNLQSVHGTSQAVHPLLTHFIEP